MTCADCGKELRPDEADAPTSDGKSRCDACWIKTDCPERERPMMLELLEETAFR